MGNNVLQTHHNDYQEPTNTSENFTTMSIQYFVLLFAAASVLGEPLGRFKDGRKDMRSAISRAPSKDSEAPEAGKQWMKAVEEMVKKIDSIGKQVDKLAHQLDNRTSGVNIRLSHVERKLSSVEAKFSRVEADISAVNTTYQKVLPSRVVRLSYAGDLDNTNGRVEVYHEGEWGTVCDTGLLSQWEDNTSKDPAITANGKNTAKVVCKQLGFSSGVPTVTGADKHQRGAGTIWMDNVVCTGDEASILDCKFDWSYDVNHCWHYEDFSVDCS